MKNLSLGKHGSQSGFSLVEVLIGGFICTLSLSLGLSGMSQLFKWDHDMQLRTKERLDAQRMVSELLDLASRARRCAKVVHPEIESTSLECDVELGGAVVPVSFTSLPVLDEQTGRKKLILKFVKNYRLINSFNVVEFALCDSNDVKNGCLTGALPRSVTIDNFFRFRVTFATEPLNTIQSGFSVRRPDLSLGVSFTPSRKGGT